MRDATVIKFSVQRMICTGCGAEANASCNCGKPYIPAKQRAAEALAANPQKSDRSIAAEIGVSHETVSKARRGSGVNELTPERLGKDGKVYRLPVRQEQTSEEFEAEIEPQNRRNAFLLRADQARQFAIYSGKITTDIIDAARQAAEAWKNLVQQMEKGA